MHFNIGDDVYIKQGWVQGSRQCTFNSDEMERFVDDGKMYTIVDSSTLDDGTIYQLDNGFWWYPECFTGEQNETTHPNWAVIRKVKKLSQRRKDLGYAF
jgi:hypothetical protein